LKGVEIEDLTCCAELLGKAMVIREKYMVLSQQYFPFTTAKYLNKVFVDDLNRRSSFVSLKSLEENALNLNFDDEGIY
jgi:hypothetical protein